ncbi:hypothetical protein [Sporolactobacillus terrae]|uniref:DUF1700 domain-containing protein n=1 Tax=Sporolactobacillus terrae TaxID=269673 RepID=A0ABX5QAY0_9BACL|nr:hypothetical protein [Sporolactobacillus terrae]QAA23769.1 hypothetical protein C0674_14895 [Sporolactobacillus terrae]QAA26740.1 hypothetical protein C0679_14880 [Sporolactobacillus terrae]
MENQQIIDTYKKLLAFADEDDSDKKIITYLRTLDTDRLQQLLTLYDFPKYSTFSNMQSVFAAGTIVALVFSFPTGDVYMLIALKLLYSVLISAAALWVIGKKFYESRIKKIAELSAKYFQQKKVQTCITFVLNEKYKKIS